MQIVANSPDRARARQFSPRGIVRDHRLQLLLVLALYLALVVPTLTRQGISWDEQIDLDIAQAYLDGPWGWLVGSPADPSQTRLPMVAAAIVLAVTGGGLLTARLISVLVGLATLLGVYVFCRRRLGHATGIVAALILTISPFFLSYARVAFTETDIYVACTLVWLMVALDRVSDRPVIGWAAVTGVALGLTVSAKFVGAAVLPAVWLTLLRSGQTRTPSRPQPYAAAQGMPVVVTCALAAVVGGLLFVRQQGYGATQAADLLAPVLIVAAVGLLSLAWAAWQRDRTAPPLLLAAFATSVATLTFLVVPPEHLTNRAILDGILSKSQDGSTVAPTFLRDEVSLHVLSILFKSGPILGAGLLAGMAGALWQWRRRELQVPLLICLCYAGALAPLRTAQPFYVVPLLPILSIFAADLFFRLRARSRVIALTVALLAGTLGSVDMMLTYPDYNLNGYQWLGPRALAGRSSIGYRSVVTTPADGVQQAFRWLNEHARTDETVLSYVYARHIVEATAPTPAYRIHYDSAALGGVQPDYVVVTINSMIPQRMWAWYQGEPVIRPPYDPHWLETNYTRAFSVRRRFGIEMAAVWQRTAPVN
jgi:4-amino-4-deoxy-L-arabinose transferase-like glycosyltransferase